jgi:glucosamine--fructose-6-phosphate aminotransferase (isomerizing)
MEYRGYDSAGIATLFRDKIAIRKGVGRVSEVNSQIALDGLPGKVGVGHTRWATHGGVTQANAHPHPSSSGQVAIVHNGIIDNDSSLKTMLIGKGYTFRSETDSEVIANLLQWNLDIGCNSKEALLRTAAALKGAYAFIAIFSDGTLGAARLNEPLVLGVAKNGWFLSSDVLGFVEQTDLAIYLENQEMVLIDHKGIAISDFAGQPVTHPVVHVSREVADLDKGNYIHYTLKEIFEQPSSILKTARAQAEIVRAAEIIKRAKKLYITGSGSSLNAGLVGKYLLSKYAGIDAEPIIASEFKFYPMAIDGDSVVLAISQSGESADVLEAVKMAQERGAMIVSIVNVMTSSLSRLSSVAIGLNCGAEIGVAATKSFTSQLSVFYRIVEVLAPTLRLDFEEVSKQMTSLLLDQPHIINLAERLSKISDVYVLGMGVHGAIASEASLKLKELAYIHAEALPGGELKHGPLALLDSHAHVLVLNPSDATYPSVIASAHEVKARNAKIIGISDRPSEIYDYWIKIPTAAPDLFPLQEIIPIQLLSYYLSLGRNVNPDYPRNLAKSVTVK